MTNTPASVIVVGVDGTPAGQAALLFAMREARLRGSGLEVVTCWEWRIPYDSAYVDDPGRARLQAEHAQEAAISAALRETTAPPVISRYVIQGDPGPELVRLSRAADYLVIGTRHRNAVQRALLGSVSRHCVRHAHGPVVVVPSSADVADPVDAPATAAEQVRETTTV